jgi:DNA-binding NtrC family response regulator
MDDMKTILIVDDEASVRESLAPILESEEVRVNEAASVAEAEQILKAQKFDLVITDLRLGGTRGTEGLDLITRIKELEPTTQVVLMTAFGSREVELEARRRGAADFWKKSILIPELISRVRALGIPIGHK